MSVDDATQSEIPTIVIGDGKSLDPEAAAAVDRPVNRNGPFVRFRTEFRDRFLGELLSTRDTDTFQIQAEEPAEESAEEVNEDENEPVFEVITTIKAKSNNHRSSLAGDEAVSTMLTKPQYHMNIYSPAIVNALRSVVSYYPSQSLEGDPVVVRWPYPILVHHYDRLDRFRDMIKAKAPEEKCRMEKDADVHLTLLLDFLDKTIMPDVREELKRNERGVHTWEWLWASYQPGATIVDRMRGEEEWFAQVIHSLNGGVFSDPPEPWEIVSWSMIYDGKYIGRKGTKSSIDKFDGESTWESHILSRVDFEGDNVDDLPDVVKQRLDSGKKYLNLLSKQCKHFQGESRRFPHNKHDGLVMVDMKDHYDETGLTPIQMTPRDCRPNHVDGSCDYCRLLRRESGKKNEEDSMVALFEDYNFITVDDADVRDDPHICVLSPVEVSAFVFKTRTWEPVHVQHLSDPVFEENMIDGLVMNEGRKYTLMSLAKSYARKDKYGEEVTKSLWTADFVRDKGSGLIFLLHGRPGVGKTCTAECIAAFTKRPLMVLTPSDIGDTPAQVEMNLTRMFKRAKSWDAVLLIDEADVFMERRVASDLARNSLVAAFLRGLENYDGILFLTTNRIGTFDDAFVSRVHVQLYYPEFTPHERQLVWKTFIQRLAQERGDYIRLNIDAKEYIESAAMRAVEWNGREIRNALQTAVALAEYDAEKDSEGKIVVTDKHLRAIVELSRDFKEYLDELHKGNESKRAQRKYERLDDYEKSSS